MLDALAPNQALSVPENVAPFLQTFRKKTAKPVVVYPPPLYDPSERRPIVRVTAKAKSLSAIRSPVILCRVRLAPAVLIRPAHSALESKVGIQDYILLHPSH
jgi:hypothetical protein